MCSSRIAKCSPTSPADARKREMLYQHDVGVARMRRILTQQVKSQLAAEEMASVRTAV